MADKLQSSEPTSFRVLRITSHSDHPVRNANEDLIYGDHLLWDATNTSGFVDERAPSSGSSAPNVFACDFGSALADKSTLLVTVKAINEDLFGGHFVLRGLTDCRGISPGIFESKPFSIGGGDETVIPVCLVGPRTRSEAFAINGDVAWMMVPSPEIQRRGGGDQEAQVRSGYQIAKETAHLELYWIAKDLDEMFLTGLSGIHVDFLRCIFEPDHEGTTSGGVDSAAEESASYFSKTYSAVSGLFRYFIPGGNQVNTTIDLHPAIAARRAFFNYNKTYDTVGGRSQFVTGDIRTGATFWYRYYVQARRGGGWGTRYRTVNCVDQAAMVQVTGVVKGYRPTYLYLCPFGFINVTSLVGVPGRCNNPFFRKGPRNTPQWLPQNDMRRTSFGCHAFNGHPGYAPSRNMVAYDGTSGPHLGRESLSQYCWAAIDYGTNLYRRKRLTAGTASQIQEYVGIKVNKLAPSEGDVEVEEMSKGVQELLEKCIVQVDSMDAPRVRSCWNAKSGWLKDVFGQEYEMGYEETVIGDGMVEKLWHLTGVEPGWDDAAIRSNGACPLGSDVVVRVRVHTRLADAPGSNLGGRLALDYDASSRAAFLDLASTLKNLEVDLGANDEQISELYAPTPLKEHAQWAVQYAPHITEGRFVLVCGNVTIDICGGPSSAALEPYVRKVLASATTHDQHANLNFLIPQALDHSLDIPILSRFEGPDGVSVRGLRTSFVVKCSMDGLVEDASAYVQGGGLLLSKFKIEDNGAKKNSTVLFTFVTRLAGAHAVDLRFAEAKTMRMSSKKVDITVC